MAVPKSAILTSAHKPFDIRIFHKQCKALAEYGYKPTLIVPHEQDTNVDGVQIQSVPIPNKRLTRMLKTTWQIYRRALLENADIYHIHDPELLPYAQLLRLRGKRVIFDMHENTPKAILTKSWLPQRYRTLAAMVYQTIEKFLLKNITVIFAESSYERDYKWISNSIVLLNYPKVPELITINASKYSAPTIGYIGDITPLRGSLIMFEALKLLHDQGHQINFECIGATESEHEKEVLNFIESHKLKGVYLRGHMQPNEGWHLLAKCKIGLAVLMPIPNYLESYPTKIFEYMALGLPIVASDFPLYREIIDRAGCGITVDPQNANAVAAAIKWLLDHQDEAKVMGRHGREAVLGKYNWDNEKKKLVNLYNSLCFKKGDGSVAA